MVLGATTSKGVKLIAVGYKYNSSKVLCFVATKNVGSTLPGEPYQARFIDGFQNLLSRPVDRPQIISKLLPEIQRNRQAQPGSSV